MRVLVLHNPGAGDGTVDRPRLGAALEEAGHEPVSYRSVKEPGWDEALELDADAVVVAGGDGTVRKAVAALAGSGALVAVVPLGTANNVARSLGVPTEDPLATIADWSAHHRRRLDVPVAQVAGVTRRFVESVGGGPVARMLQTTADDSAPARHDGLAELSSLVAEAPLERWDVWLDGEKLALDLLGCEVTNNPTVGPALAVAPSAEPDDGLLEVVTVGADDRAALAEHLARRARGMASPPPALEVRRTREIVLDPPRGMAFHVDDELRDPGGHPVEVAIDGTTLDVIVPARHGERRCAP